MSHPFDLLSIPGIKGKLIFTPCPGTKETSVAEALDTLKAAGASAVITLMPKGELIANAADSMPDLCAERGLGWFHLPVADEQVPLEDFATAWESSKNAIKALLVEGKNIAIHCKGGSGRTGLIAARIMIESGIPRAEAIALVQALRPKAIQHPAHIGWINQFGAS